ncbi:MAG TPA: NADH-quinone oxidoreductase subunit N [Actinomycetes bacterium]
MHVLAQAAETPLNLPKIEWRAVAPELALVGAGLVVLLVVAWWPRVRRDLLAALCLAGIAVAAWLTWWNWDLAKTAFEGAVALDGITRYARLVLLAVGALAVLMAAEDGARDPDAPPEVFPLLLFALAGMSLLAAASDLLVVFIALELLSLSLYVMAGATRRLRAEEAAMKYFLLGAFSSAFLLYGIALSYGATHTTNLLGIAHAVGDPTMSSGLLLAGVGLLSVGFFFKVAAVPFHQWTPDVYQGAPTPVTAFMAAGTKTAGFAVFLRVFAGALGGLVVSWRPVVVVVAVATMLVGAVLALVQQDLKRMLAYSSIAHAGYLLLGLAAAATRPEGVSASMFYLLAYAFMVMGAFMVVQYAGRAPASEAAAATAAAGAGALQPIRPVGAGVRVAEVATPATAAARPPGAGAATVAEAQAPARPATATVEPGVATAGANGRARALDEPVERSSIDDFRGFGRRHFLPALLLAIFLLSLAGIPPLAGFWAKYYLFQAAVDAGLTWLVVVAVIASVISAFFYLRVIVAMFLDEPAGEGFPGSSSWALRIALGVAGVLTVAIGLAPQVLVTAAQAAGRILG